MKIIVRLAGGIGNQIFQYATGRFLASSHNGELLLDDSLLRRRRSGVTIRDYALDVYDIHARKLLPREESMLQLRVTPPFKYLFEAGILKSSFIYYREPHFEYDPNLFHVPGNIIIEGYWQSERYFSTISDKLRQELQPVKPPPNYVQDLMKQIMKVNSVSLHVRRGDFVNNPHAAKNHVVCDLEYYKRAISIMADQVLNPVFYIFSDDPAWVEEKLHIRFPMVIVSNPQSIPSHEDLRLMSHCANHIIANSSFSWWGAWLNPKPDKIVIAPTNWFHNERNLNDLVPPEWYRT